MRCTGSEITEVTGNFPYRIALAGGWIDQPFVSRFNPSPPGSMVVVSIVPQYRFMDRAGFASSTRKVAADLWREGLPHGDPSELVKNLYQAENNGKADPSGSQDMIGMIYPGINRLDYDFQHEGGIFPVKLESCCDPETARWLESVLHLIPVCQRPHGYNPLGIKNLVPEWIQRLGQTGKDCYRSILKNDLPGLGQSMNDCMECWETILPNTVRHTTIQIDLIGIMRYYQDYFPGAMYSGCGGGYLIVASENEVPGSFQVKIRLV